MFQLIVAVISIALVAALAIASIFYGGDAFTRSSEKAQIATMINQGQQISGAAALYKTDKGMTFANGALTVLVDEGYLASDLTGPKLAPGAWTVATSVGTDLVDPADDYKIAQIALSVDATEMAAFCDKVNDEIAANLGGCTLADGSTPADLGTATHFSYRL